MAEYQRVIDEIRFQLQSSDCELTDELRQLASSYSAACRSVNQRLRRCGEFLRLGLRSEAIQFAEAEPNLLELVTRLDFPEREAWEELVTMYQLPRMEPLLLDMAEMLNEAYADQEPLTKLLTTHRLMALAKSPLKQRLDVVRKLADLDLQASFWDDDVREMEKARLHEIKVEANAAKSKGDHSRLKDLLVEVQDSQWRNAPPPSYVKSISEMAGAANENWARKELEQLEAELNDAFGALDLPRAQQLRDQWDMLAPQAELAPDDPIWENSGPILDWIRDEEEQLAKQQAYEDAVGYLELALEKDRIDLPDLERLGHEVNKFNKGLPEPLATRYRNRIASLQFADTRRRNLIIAGVALGIILVIGSIGFLIQRQLRSSEIIAVASTVEQMIDNGQLADARAMVDKHSDFPIHESWLAAQKKLGDAEKTEQDRLSQVQGLIASAESTTSHNQAVKYLEQAREIAHTSEEKLAIGRLEMEWEEHRQNEVAAREEAFRQLVDKATNKLEQSDSLLAMVDPTNQDTNKDLQQLDQLLKETDQDLQQLNSAKGMVRSTSSSQVKLLETRATALKDAHKKLEQQSSLFDEMTRQAAISSEAANFEQALSGYDEALKNYVTSFPNDPRSSDFKKVATHAKTWSGAMKWQQLWHSWSVIPPRDLQDVVAQIAECEKFLDDFPEAPSASVAKSYLTYLKSIRMREESSDGDRSDGAKSQMAALFENALLSKVYLLELKDGKKYYLLAPLKKKLTNAASTEVVNFHPITDYYSALGGNESKGTGKIKQVGEIKTLTTSLAPHAVIGSRVKETIDNCSLNEWDTYCLGLCKRILSDPEIDDFLKYFLLLRTAELAGEGNAHLKETMASVIRKFQDDEIDLAVNWMDPENEAAQTARELAADALKRVNIQDFESAWDESKKQTEQLTKRVQCPISVVGHLEKDKKGSWKCLTSWEPKGDYQLQVVVPSGTSHTWASIGSARGNSITLNGQLSGAHAIEGQLIFAIPKAAADLAFANR
ncbi:hypothetical protein [Bremerella sp. P1]|uniref:hypothetical protein n=1 Tax=Bremerella sp. P1 TaxID=3026424 RepID=UPI002367DB74|nr:hypothetical protein [Bremerella sp. P1]WDI43734.1 hypothetical protein PSR63_07210 [Bremerella sp. P1]